MVSYLLLQCIRVSIEFGWMMSIFREGMGSDDQFQLCTGNAHDDESSDRLSVNTNVLCDSHV
jgi:hypothetical protein